MEERESSDIRHSSLGGREATYDAANSAPTWVSGAEHYFEGCYADTAGTTSDPKLVVTYTLGGTAALPVTGVLGSGVWNGAYFN